MQFDYFGNLWTLTSMAKQFFAFYSLVNFFGAAFKNLANLLQILSLKTYFYITISNLHETFDSKSYNLFFVF